MRRTLILVGLMGWCFGACASRSSDRAPGVPHAATNAYFACLEHCDKRSENGSTCVEFDRGAALACEVFQVDNVRSEDQDYIVDQYPACMQTCKKPSDDGLFCRKFDDSTTEVCRTFYGV